MILRVVVSLIICIALLQNASAQDLSQYNVDLDNDMHYKVNASNWQERGIKEFKDVMLVLFKKGDFDSNSIRIENYPLNMTIR